MNAKTEAQSPYAKLAAINVNEHIEKKSGLSYLSWAWAVDQLLRQDPQATWEFHDPIKYGKETWMVSCTVTAFGIARKMFLPVMDHRNKAIPDPDSFAFNTAMMRCLVKAIALHGLGLYIYAGEDLPEGEESKPASAKPVTQDVWDSLDPAEQKFLQEIADEVIAAESPELQVTILQSRHLDADEKVALWSRFDSKTRTAIKKAQEAMSGSIQG